MDQFKYVNPVWPDDTFTRAQNRLRDRSQELCGAAASLFVALQRQRRLRGLVDGGVHVSADVIVEDHQVCICGLLVPQNLWDVDPTLLRPGHLRLPERDQLAVVAAAQAPIRHGVWCAVCGAVATGLSTGSALARARSHQAAWEEVHRG